MSGLFTKKYVEQQEFQEGEVPDDHSDQPEPNLPLNIQPKVDKKKQQLQEDQFIFQTVPDDIFEGDFKSRDKSNYKSQDYYPQQQQKKQWDKYYEKEKSGEKGSSQKSAHKKDTSNLQNKRKAQTIHEEPQIRGNIPLQMVPSQPMGFYSNVPPVPTSFLPPGYYPPYGPQPTVRNPYAMYPPQMHHQPPSGMYVAPPPQGPYQIPNPHMYQIPTYGTVSMIPPVPDLYRIQHPQIMQNRSISQQQIKPYGYEQPVMAQRNQSQSPYNQASKFIPPPPQQRQAQNRQKQDPRQAFDYRQKPQEQHRYAEQRQRSRDRKEFHDYENTRQQRKQKYSERNSYESKGNYDQSYKDRKQSQFSSSQNEKKIIKQQKKSQQEELKGKLKSEVSENLKILFGSNNEEKEEFLFVLRDVLKFRLLRKQQEEISRFSNFQTAKPVLIYTLNKDVIESNHEKALLKLQNFIITLAQQQKLTNSELAVNKRESLFKILSSLQLDDLITKIKEMRLKKKLIGQRKMSEIKRLLEELVKDPRKRIK